MTRRLRPLKHRCAAFGCRTMVPYRYLMCARHWALVPRDIQTAVYAAWNEGNKTAGWHAAVRRAIGAVNKQGELFA